LAKTRYFIGLRPQLGFNITDKWRINTGTQVRYYFQPFFDGYYFGIKEDGVHFDLLGNLGISYNINEQFSLGLNYNRGFGTLRHITISSNLASEYTSSVRYHSLGLNVSYSF
jgi:long-subunit fatty acid transport protein